MEDTYNYNGIEWIKSIQFYKTLRYKKREIIFEQGDPAFGLYHLCSGMVKLWRRTRSGHRQILALLQGQGYLLGMEALIENHYDYTVCTMEDSQLLFIAREDFLHLPGIELLKAAAQVLRSLERQLANTLGLGAKERLARILLQRQLIQQMQRYELAALTGLSLEHTCRLLEWMERRGWIRRNGHIIEILDLQGIKSLCTSFSRR